MQFRNSMDRYGLIAISFHWLMAIIIIGLIALGVYMVPLSVSSLKLKLYRWHKEFGLIILYLIFFRLAWRLADRTPSLLGQLPWWQKIAAKTVHATLYFFMFIVPMTGWLLTSATGFPVSFFGWFLMPDLVQPNEVVRVWMVFSHKWLSYIMAGLICVHIAATIQHYVVHKDNILRKMLP